MTGFDPEMVQDVYEQSGKDFEKALTILRPTGVGEDTEPQLPDFMKPAALEKPDDVDQTFWDAMPIDVK